MAEKIEQSPKVESPPKNSAWVFDERTGWIDVNEFLNRTHKLNEEMDRKIHTREEKKSSKASNDK